MNNYINFAIKSNRSLPQTLPDMKIPRFIACLTALLCMAAGCRSEDDAAVRALARRIIPEHEKQFRFERLTDTTECFELESRGSKIVVRGNSSASIAVGLNIT